MVSACAASAFDTSIGTCALAWGEDGALRLLLPGRGEIRRRMQRTLGGASLQWDSPPAQLRRACARIAAYLAGDGAALRSIAVDLAASSPFHREVFHSLREVPTGRTISYGALATLAGRPGAARAVGSAMARNPLPLLVPCHRVLPASGALGDFSAPGGARTKLTLLTLEGADLGPAWRAAPRELSRADSDLAALIRRVGPCHLGPVEADGFSSLARSIVHQQVSVAAGRTIFSRLAALVGPGDLEPERVLALSPQALREAGVSRQKGSYLQDLARLIVEGALPLKRLSHLDDEAVIEALTKVKGVGRWSAQMFLLFQLRRLDVFPAGDLGFLRGIERLYGLRARPSKGRLETLRKRWSPYASVASWYCWRALEED